MRTPCISWRPAATRCTTLLFLTKLGNMVLSLALVADTLLVQIPDHAFTSWYCLDPQDAGVEAGVQEA